MAGGVQLPVYLPPIYIQIRISVSIILIMNDHITLPKFIMIVSESLQTKFQ